MAKKAQILAENYFSGQLQYPDHLRGLISQDRFDALAHQFYLQHDDFYHDDLRSIGEAGQPLIGLMTALSDTFMQTTRAVDSCYINCAISSGMRAHYDIVKIGHHITDKTSRFLGSDWVVSKHIIPNSQTSLERAQMLRGFLPDHYMVTPSAFEGATRVMGGYRSIDGGMPMEAAHYMAFWNIVIDHCKAFILDDPLIDQPTKDQLIAEITGAQAGDFSAHQLDKKIQTADWINSRNSIYEMYRGNAVRFGLNPMRPDANMDMYMFDQASGTLHYARLVDCAKAAAQNILRWAPQGIATVEAVKTLSRLINIHRMRTDHAYNQSFEAPIDLQKIDERLADPKSSEIQEMDDLIRVMEPILLQDLPHLLNPSGLPSEYAQAQDRATIKPADIGERSVKWQRENLDVQRYAEAWEVVQIKPLSKRTPDIGQAMSLRSVRSQPFHDFKDSPFAEEKNPKVWDDSPYEDLNKTEQGLIKMILGAAETGLLPVNNPEYIGMAYDTKAGALSKAFRQQEQALSVTTLPSAMGTAFKEKILQPNIDNAQEVKIALQQGLISGGQPSIVQGGPLIQRINSTINQVYSKFPTRDNKPGADFRLALAMKLIDRDITQYVLEPGWAQSENSTKLMMRATMVELGLVERREGKAGLTLKDTAGQTISLAQRFYAIKDYLHQLKQDYADNLEALAEHDGAKTATLALARLMHIHDAHADPTFNDMGCLFAQHEDYAGFINDINSITLEDKLQLRAQIMPWVGFWQEKDLHGLPQDYSYAWHQAQGTDTQNAGGFDYMGIAVNNGRDPQ